MLFRKIISNLPYSPALVNQLGFYAQRLRKEQVTRRIGLLFTILALIVQTFAILRPPEPALAANQNNIIFNGIHSKEDLLQAWDRNTDGHSHRDIQQIFQYFLGQDFSRKDLENTKKGEFGSRDRVNGGRILSLGRTQQTSDPEQKAHAVRDANGNKSIIWSRHLDAFDTGANRSGRGSIYEAYIGSHNGKWFAIMFSCGNLAFSDTVKVPTITPSLKVTATCREINGYAYDKSNLKASLKVYIYLDGGPGKGEKFATVANLATPSDGVEGNHGFSLTVPAKYHTGKSYSYSIIAMPAFPENQSMQFNGTLDTKSCVAPTPIASCDSLVATRVQGKRDSFVLQTNASAANGAKVTGYRYEVTNQQGSGIYTKTYTSSSVTHSSEQFSLPAEGVYLAKVTVLTTIGEKTGPNCNKPLTVTPIEKCALNPTIPATDKDCQPCPGNPSIPIKDAGCSPEIIQAKTVKNLTQNINDAKNTTVKPGDRLQYDLYVENTGALATTLTLEENLSDVLEYASLTDFGGTIASASFDQNTQKLSWKDVKLNPGEKLTKTIIVSVKETIPSTPKSAGNPESYDCRMGNVFGGASVVVDVQCPDQKIVENTVEQLPETGIGANVLFSVVLITTVTYFYMRSRQMNKEVRLIRKDFNAGTI